MVTRFCCEHRFIVLAGLAWIGRRRSRPRRAQAAAQPPPATSRQADSPLNGILIGAGVGAIPGIYWLVVDPNECTGLCPEDYAAIGGRRGASAA